MRPFTDVIRDIRKGRVVDACSAELQRVVQAVLDTEKPGELILKISVKPQGKGDNVVIVGAKVTSKLPQAPLPDALFFTDADGDLLREDPTNMRMFADARETVDPVTGEIRVS